MRNTKLYFALLILITGMAFSFKSASALPGNNEANLIGRARGAANPCIGQSNQPHTEVVAEVETLGICFVSGEINRVSFYRVYRCNEQQQDPCPRPFVQLIATVEFGCDEEITSVQCYTN